MMFGEMITRRCLLTLDGGGKDSSHPHNTKADKAHFPRGNGASYNG